MDPPLSRITAIILSGKLSINLSHSPSLDLSHILRITVPPIQFVGVKPFKGGKSINTRSQPLYYIGHYHTIVIGYFQEMIYLPTTKTKFLDRRHWRSLQNNKCREGIHLFLKNP